MRPDFRLTCFVLFFAISACSLSYSQAPATAPSPANALDGNAGSDAIADAIRVEGVAFAAVFNQEDAKAVAAFWTEDGEYIDESGQAYVGREAIETLYRNLFTSSDSKLQLITDSVRLLSDSACLEDGRAVVEPVAGGAAIVSSYTAVHVKVADKWLMASVRESGTVDSPASNDLADLDWLIGDWTAEENGVRTVSKCRWIVNNRFVERSYTTMQVDGTTTTGLQIIGWNPQSNHVQSWNFTADGGHAIGIWSATDGGWLAKVTGTTGSSDSTSAVNVLRRLDDNAYVWQSIDRVVGDTRLPDTDEVVIRRKTSRK
jgi:uncharacterized protein (TIGR02246 family)